MHRVDIPYMYSLEIKHIQGTRSGDHIVFDLPDDDNIVDLFVEKEQTATYDKISYTCHEFHISCTEPMLTANTYMRSTKNEINVMDRYVDLKFLPGIDVLEFSNHTQIGRKVEVFGAVGSFSIYMKVAHKS